MLALKLLLLLSRKQENPTNKTEDIPKMPERRKKAIGLRKKSRTATHEMDGFASLYKESCQDVQEEESSLAFFSIVYIFTVTM
ncbi:hypothetical protein SLA2020_007030 [Shorea laevis]